MTKARRPMVLMTLALAVLAAGCDGIGSGGPTLKNAADAEEAEGDNLANAVAEPVVETKSIIRPTVIDVPETPVLKPAKVDIPFGDRTSALDDAGKKLLDDLIATDLVKAGGAIVLRGHSDSKGSDSDNLLSSRHRAEAVRAYLEDKGIAADRLSVVALGETRPIAPNANLDGSDDPAGRARNRRVEVEVQPPTESAPQPKP